MITLQELLGRYKLDDQTEEIQTSLKILLDRVNKIRAWWNKPMIVTSGLRTMEDHLRIYAAKGITDPKKIPMQSRHLTGRAVDIADPDLKITAWLKSHPLFLEEAELWCEDQNKNWVHFQTVPPTSGKRWFLPEVGYDHYARQIFGVLQGFKPEERQQIMSLVDKWLKENQ